MEAVLAIQPPARSRCSWQQYHPPPGPGSASPRGRCTEQTGQRTMSCGAGFVLLSATLAAGFLFSETLYGPGKAWKWDHKTVFSVLSWIAFALLLLGRARFGWRGRKAVRFLYIGALLLLLSYVGSRFVLEVVLGRTP
jgi:hypothetical protein